MKPTSGLIRSLRFRSFPWLGLATAALLALLVTACGAPTAEDHLARGRALLGANDLRAAIIELRSAVAASPDSAEARWTLAQALIKAGQGAAAEKEIEQAIQHGFDGQEAYVEQARARLLQGKADLALELLERHRPDPVTAAYLITSGDIRAALGQIDPARTDYEQALRAAPDAVDAVLGLARLAMSRSDVATARLHVETAAKLDDTHAETAVVRGNLEFWQRNYAASAAAFEQASHLAPYAFFPYLGQARALLAAGQWQEAIPAIDRALNLAPNNPLGNVFKAYTLAHGGDAKAAIDRCRAVLQVFPTFSQAQFLLATLLFQSGEAEQAADLLKVYVGSNAQDPAAWRLLSTVQLTRKQPEQAITSLRTAFDEQNPGSPEIHVLFGTAYVQLAKLDEARFHFERAAELVPANQDYALRAKLLDPAMEDPQRAVQILRELISAEPDFAPPQRLLIVHYLRRGELDEAINAAQEALQRTPDDPHVLTLLAAAHRARDEDDVARTYLEEALSKQADFVPAILDLAALEERQDKPEAAKALLRDLLDKQPDNPGALGMLAANLRKAGQVDDAFDLLQRCRAKNPGALPCLRELAQIHYEQGRMNDAYRIAREAYELAPRDPQLNLILGDIAHERQAHAEALSYLTPLAEANPTSPPVLVRLARTEMLLGRFDASEAHLRSALASGGDPAEILALLAHLEFERGNLPAAVSFAQECLEQGDRTPLCLELAGDLAVRDKALQDGLAYYAEAFEREANTRLMLKQLRALRLLQKHTEAEALLDAWLTAHPEDIRALFSRAESYDLDGKRAKAKATYEKILGIDPANAVALNNVALLFLAEGDKRAIEYAQKALQAAPDSAQIKDTYGWILIETGQHEQGRVLVKQALEQAPTNPSFNYHRAVAAIRLGDRREARDSLARALESEHFSERAAAERLLASLDER